jgi:hypothetical protein
MFRKDSKNLYPTAIMAAYLTQERPYQEMSLLFEMRIVENLDSEQV